MSSRFLLSERVREIENQEERKKKRRGERISGESGECRKRVVSEKKRKKNLTQEEPRV
jgi:hypothetical protein